MAGEHVVQAGIYPHRTRQMEAWTREALESRGYRYKFLDRLGGPDDARTLARADAVIAVIGEQWGADEFGRLVRCQLFISPGVGLDAVDLEAAANLGIAVCNQP